MLINEERKERRKEERVSVSLPVSMAHADDVTHNISPSGVYFEVHAPFDLGQLIDFVVEFCHPGGNLKLKCQGEAVRVENRDSKFGVAVKILDSVMVAAQQYLGAYKVGGNYQDIVYKKPGEPQASQERNLLRDGVPKSPDESGSYGNRSSGGVT